MARRRIWASAPLFLLFLAPALAFDADFSFYPSTSQPCLNNAAKASKCTGATSGDLNKCLCSNGGNFVIDAAACLGRSDPSNVRSVFSTMADACSFSKTNLTVSERQFIAAANAASSTTTSSVSSAVNTRKPTTAVSSPTVTATPTSTPTSTPTDTTPSDRNQNGGGLSTGATVGIAVGASLGGVAIIAGIVVFLLRRQRRRGEESHPMLPQDPRYSAATTFPPTEPSPGFSPFSLEAKPPAWASPQQSPDPSYPSYRSSEMTWDSAQGAYKGPYASPDNIAELPPDTATHGSHGSQIFEMDGVGRGRAQPAEMQGSLPLRNSHGS